MAYRTLHKPLALMMMKVNISKEFNNYRLVSIIIQEQCFLDSIHEVLLLKIDKYHPFKQEHQIKTGYGLQMIITLKL